MKTAVVVRLPQGDDPTCLVRLVEATIETLRRHRHETGVPVRVQAPYDTVVSADLRVLPTAQLEGELSLIVGQGNVIIERSLPRRSIPSRIRFLVMKRDGYRCQLCGRPANDGVQLDIDHKISLANGGSNNVENLWVLCSPCNNGKSTSDL